jgi:hypothetical protein
MPAACIADRKGISMNSKPHHLDGHALRGAALLCLLAGACAAQDSVSRNANGGSGLPGDALRPWTGASQRTNYVVDLTPLSTSGGTPLGIAPIMKSGQVSASRFTAFNGAASISQTLRRDTPFPAASYASWAAPGGGVNSTENNQALVTPVPVSGNATVFGVGFMDFDELLVSATNVFTNQLVGGLIAFDPAAPDRLYVSRIVAAVNNPLGANDRSQFGYGAIDADGNLCFRADSFGASGPATSLLVGDNYFRVKLATRGTTVNVIDNAGATAPSSTDWILQRSSMTHATPACVPQDVAGRPLLVGADFAGSMKLEQSPLTLASTTAHRPASTDHRGAVSVSGRAIFPGSVATAAILARSLTGGGKTDAMSVSGLLPDGSVATARTLKLPATLTDACDSFAWPLGGGDFRHFDSQVTFRGGTGPVSVALDQSGRAVAAAVLHNGGSPLASNPFNAIAAARFNPADPLSAVQWTTIGWVNSTTLTGKELQGDYGADGIPGTADAGEADGQVDATDAPIGRLASMSELGVGLVGPSMSTPTFDAAGNAYFVAAAALKRRTGPQNPFDFKLVVVRGLYDPSSFCYSLEVLAESGQVFAGRNSGRSYRLAALNLADADSISTAAIWSGSAMQQAWNGEDTSSLSPDAPQHLGGLALSARIVYDVDQDGLFNDPTAIGGDVNSVDEAYNVVLYVGNVTPLAPPCPADYNADGGVDGADVEAFFVDWESGSSAADVNFDGGVDGGDLEVFFIAWSNGGC